MNCLPKVLSATEPESDNLHSADPVHAPKNRLLPSAFFTTGILLFAFSCLRGPIILWKLGGTTVFPSGTYCSIFAGLLILSAFFIQRSVNPRLLFSLPIFSYALLAVFFSDWLCIRYNLFQGPAIRTEIAVGALVTLLSIILLRRYASGVFGLFALGLPLFLIYNFLAEARGRLIFSDDHPAMLYRLILLKDNFPFIPFYNPYWNAGSDARDFFATGVLNLYFLGYPLIAWFEVVDVYNLLVSLSVFFLVPSAMYFAARVGGFKPIVGLLAGIVSVASSLFWYRWCFKYGAMGFITSASLVPLNVFFVTRILDRSAFFPLSQAIIFLISCSLMLLWTPTGLIFLPIIVYALFSLPVLLKKPNIKATVMLLLLLNIPWMLLFVKVSKVTSFVHVKSETARGRLDTGGITNAIGNSNPQKEILAQPSAADDFKLLVLLQQARTHIRGFAVNTNPLLIFLGIPGIFLISNLTVRRVLLLTSGWLFLVGVGVAPLKPQLELDRMLLVLALLLCIPAALVIDKLFTNVVVPEFKARWLSIVPLCFIGGFLFSGFFAVQDIIQNKTLERYNFKDGSVNELSQAIQTYSGSGRVLFSGFVLHELAQGHFAPLAHFANHPLVASGPFHSQWKHVDVIPDNYLARGSAGIEEYLDMLNITAVFAHERKWKDYFTANPQLYELSWKNKRFNLYKRQGYQGNYFLLGSGELLTQQGSSVNLKVDSTEAVVKFNYFDFLQAPGCDISPFEASESLRLIRLSNCVPGSVVKISSKGALSRLLGSEM